MPKAAGRGACYRRGMPDWLITIAVVIVSAGLFALLIIDTTRAKPPRYRDPNLTERERNEDFWDRQW